MAVFAIVAPEIDPRLEAALGKEFEGAFLQIGPGQFLLVVNNVTTPEVAQKLGSNDGAVGRVFIASVSNYTGWHNKDIWEWLAARAQNSPPTAPSKDG